MSRGFSGSLGGSRPIVAPAPSITASKYVRVNLATGDDETATGDPGAPFRTIQGALDRLFLVSPRLTSRRLIMVTGAALAEEQVKIPPFASQLSTAFDFGGEIPLTLLEHAITIHGDPDFGAQTPVTAAGPGWQVETDGPSGMKWLTVTGLSVAADELVGRQLLGTGFLEVAWIGRNDATSGGETKLYLSTANTFGGALRIATPIILRAPGGTVDATLILRGVGCGVSVLGLRVEHPDASSGWSVEVHGGEGGVWFGGSYLRHGYHINSAQTADFYQSAIASGVAHTASSNASRPMSHPVRGPAFSQCLYLAAYHLGQAHAGVEAHANGYSRYCNDLGHGGGTYLTAGQFDWSGCYVDGYSGQGSGGAFNYAGGPASSIDACTVRPGTAGHGVVARSMGGGLRVKDVAGSVSGYGINAGSMTSPQLAGSAEVRISTTTAITGSSGDMLIGTLPTSYATLRALPSGQRRVTDSARFATVWENS